MNLIALLDTTTGTQKQNPLYTYIFLGAIIVLFIVFLVINNRKAKKKEEETKSMLDAIKPGNKVKTIGGICGIVKEVDKEDNTFVLETGSEATGKSYIKFDKQAVYQTDAKPEPKEEGKEEVKAEPAIEEPVKEEAEKSNEETK